VCSCDWDWYIWVWNHNIVSSCVPDPHPEPQDPDVFEPPGFASGSVIYLYGSGSFNQQAKKLRKALISTVLRLLYDFLSLKNDVPSKRKKHRNLKKKFFFDDNRAGSPFGSGSVSQRYGSEDSEHWFHRIFYFNQQGWKNTHYY
jgi:hypothetical protein